ncbi:MAG: LacI family DNA-binding transcriptional regulator [Actinomycetota bacterium]|nr:LacI family DNA-binding transcriptional regulator [Actinomycetota bacterium]
MARYNIKDVAKVCGVSISTVSHALNDSRYVKKETKEKIFAIASEIGYKPSALAKGLRRKSLNTIAVFIPNIASQFFSQILLGVNKIANKNDFHIIIVNTFYNSEEESRLIESLKSQYVDGAIFVSGLDNRDCIKELHKENFPIVLVARKISEDIPSVLIDNFEAAKSGVDYLVSLGHKDIGYVTFEFENRSTVKDRFEGYKQGLVQNGLEFSPEKVLKIKQYSMDEMGITYECCKKFYVEKKLPTAIMTVTDNVAAGVYNFLKEKGCSIPEDISLVGFDNLLLSAFLDPPLTTIEQPKEKMGECAMEMIINIIKNRHDIKNNIVNLDSKLIVRKSAFKCKK